MSAPYPQLVRAGFRRYASYRQAAFAGLTANVVFGFLRAAVLVAVLAQQGTVAGYDIPTAVTYVWLGQGLLSVVQLWPELEFSKRIRSGDVVIDLGRPWDLTAAMLATDLGRAGHAMVVRFIPPMLLGIVFFPFRWPQRPVTWLLFLVSIVLAVVVSFTIRFMLSATAFWMLDAHGVLSVWGAVSGIVVGLIVPLAWFPQWAQAVLAWTPFPAIMQSPIDVFTERGDVVALLGHAAIWSVLLFAACKLMLRAGAKKLVVQGG